MSKHINENQLSRKCNQSVVAATEIEDWRDYRIFILKIKKRKAKPLQIRKVSTSENVIWFEAGENLIYFLAIVKMERRAGNNPQAHENKVRDIFEKFKVNSWTCSCVFKVRDVL